MRAPFVAGALIVALAGPASAGELTPAAVIAAVQRQVCFEYQWGGRDARYGQVAHAKVRIVGDDAYIWSDDLRTFPRSAPASSFYAVHVRQGVTFAGRATAWNMNLDWGGTPDFLRHRVLAVQASSLTVDLQLPTNCDERVRQSTPEKADMLARVGTAIAIHLAEKRRSEHRRPRPERIVLADFNPEDPEAYGIVESTGEALMVNLHGDVSDPASDVQMSMPAVSAWTLQGDRAKDVVKQVRASSRLVRVTAR